MEEKRLISKERGEKVAEENGIKFYETSAKENVNIEHAFITVSTDLTLSIRKTFLWTISAIFRYKYRGMKLIRSMKTVKKPSELAASYGLKKFP